MTRVDTDIPVRSGTTLGSISCAFAAHVKPDRDQTRTLAQAAELATLAIETRRLYSDLTHRSEFDLLTDAHNRFSFEKQLDATIEHCSASAECCGLIYIDLDGFKQINDFYGHRVGDQYLQKVAMRMQRQIRPADTFARLGGDEFAVLVSTARTEADVREIARRLFDCFKEPFEIDRHIFTGAASFGVAFYPVDGLTKDALFNAADSRMYESKRAQKNNAALRQNAQV